MGGCPQISVVIPTRSRLGFLKDAVASVLAQACDGFEVLVVDDASEDGTWEWLRSLSDRRVRVFRQAEWRERSAARNVGLREARGEMALFLDDDDLLLPRALRCLSAGMEAHPEAVAAVGAGAIWDGEGITRRSWRPGHTVVRDLWPEVVFAHWAEPSRCLFRTEPLRACGGWGEMLNVGEDSELWLRLGILGPVVFVRQTVTLRRQHAGQTQLSGVEEIEEKFKTEFVRGLTGEAGRQGERMLRSFRELNAARGLVARSCYVAALGRELRILGLTPELLLSPAARLHLLELTRDCVVEALAPRGTRRRQALRRVRDILRPRAALDGL